KHGPRVSEVLYLASHDPVVVVRCGCGRVGDLLAAADSRRWTRPVPAGGYIWIPLNRPAEGNADTGRTLWLRGDATIWKPGPRSQFLETAESIIEARCSRGYLVRIDPARLRRQAAEAVRKSKTLTIRVPHTDTR